jgi:hypothetical protein
LNVGRETVPTIRIENLNERSSERLRTKKKHASEPFSVFSD